MVICKYFLEGRCRFGDRCRNEHIQNDQDNFQNSYYDRTKYYSPVKYKSNEDLRRGNRYSGYEESYGYNTPYNKSPYTWYSPDLSYEHRPSRYDTDSYSFKQPQPNTFDSYKKSSKNTEFTLSRNRFEVLNEPRAEKERASKQNSAVIDLVKEDMVAWDEGNQWPFSCYFPLKGHPAFPDFHDISPEELRYEAYESEKNNNFPAYVQSVTEAIAAVKEKRNHLKNPSAEVLRIINKINNEKLNLDNDTQKNPSVVSGFFTGSVPSTSNDTSSRKALFGKQPSAFGSNGGNRFSLSHLVENNSKSNVAGSSSGFSLSHLMGKVSNGTASQNVHEEEMENSKPDVSGSVFRFVVPERRIDFSFKLPASETPSKYSGKEESTVYTPLENLADDEKEAFASPVFVVGKIPVQPPALKFCF